MVLVNGIHREGSVALMKEDREAEAAKAGAVAMVEALARALTKDQARIPRRKTTPLRKGRSRLNRRSLPP